MVPADGKANGYAAMRLPLFLDDHEVQYETLLHAPAYSAQRRANYLGIPGKQLAKCVLLKAATGYVVAVLPASHRVDLVAVAQALGQPVHLAGEREIAQLFADCEWGGLVPFGTLYGASTIVDEALNEHDWLVFSGQRQFLAHRLRYEDFARLEQPRRFHFAALPGLTAARERRG
jgi:Ala-tRNA(Pro) deacylase